MRGLSFDVQHHMSHNYHCKRLRDFYGPLLQDSVVMERLIEKYMSLPNQAWDNIVKEATRVSKIVFAFANNIYCH